MAVLTKYIVREVLKGSAVSLLILLTLFNLFTFSDELKDLGVGRYGLKEIFLYLALISPRTCYDLMPSAALLGSLFVVGAMGDSREIIAMRAAGLSVFWVIKAVMLAGLMMAILAVVVGEFIAPDAERTGRLIKTTAQNNKVVMHTRYGLWLREGNRFMNVRKVQEKGDLADIYIYQLNEQGRLLTMSQVASAHYLGDEMWHMQDISQTEITPKQIFASKIKEKDWQSSIDPDLLKVVVIPSENMSLYDLYMYISFLKENNQKSQSYELAFWRRLFKPLVIFVMLMVSIPFVISVRRGIRTGGRIMLGIFIGMLFNIFDKIAGHVGLVYGYNPMLMAFLPSLLVFCAAVYTTRKIG